MGATAATAKTDTADPTPIGTAAHSGLPTASLAERQEFINMLYYGDGGTAKTTNAAFMANLGRVLYIDAESGIKRRPLAAHGVNVANIELLTPEMGLSIETLEEAFWQLKRDLENDPESWAGTVWDSGSEIYRVLLDAIVERRVAKASKVSSASASATTEMMKDRFFIDRDNYGVMSEQMRFLLRRFRDLPCHFAVTTLMRRDQDSDGKVKYGPAVTPGLQNDLIGYPDIVCRTYVEAMPVGPQGALEEVYKGSFRPVGVYQGKDRFLALPRVLVNPRFDRVVAYVNDSITTKTDPVMVEYRKAKRAASAGSDANAVGKGDTGQDSEGTEPDAQGRRPGATREETGKQANESTDSGIEGK